MLYYGYASHARFARYAPHPAWKSRFAPVTPPRASLRDRPTQPPKDKGRLNCLYKG